MPAKQSSPDASCHLLCDICYIRRVNNNYINLFEEKKNKKKKTKTKTKNKTKQNKKIYYKSLLKKLFVSLLWDE